MIKEKFTIAMFGHKHVLSREGGVEVVVKELSVRMVKRGHNVLCYDRDTRHVCGSDLSDKSEYLGVKIIPVCTVDKKGLSAITSSFFAAVKASFSKVDIVHIHAEGPAAMCWLPKLMGKKVIVTIHGLDWQRAKWGGLASWYIKFGEKQAVKFADKIIVLSHGLQSYFSTTYRKETFYIPNGVAKPKVLPAKKIFDLWGLKKDSYVLYLGRIVPEKGINYLLEAWKNIKTDKKLIIVGGSSDTDSYMEQLKSKASSNVIFAGFQQGDILGEFYSNSYLYVLPSDIEGMPLSLLEAMSYGNCCLVSSIPECTEVIEDKAVVFEKSNKDELQKVLQKLLDNPLIVNKYKLDAAEFITNKYDWDMVVDKTLSVYKS